MDVATLCSLLVMGEDDAPVKVKLPGEDDLLEIVGARLDDSRSAVLLVVDRA